MELRRRSPRPNTEILARISPGAGIGLAVATSAGLAPAAQLGYGGHQPRRLPCLNAGQRARPRRDEAAAGTSTRAHRDHRTQARQALAALAISKSQMAAILGIERPHLYAWLADKVETPRRATVCGPCWRIGRRWTRRRCAAARPPRDTAPRAGALATPRAVERQGSLAPGRRRPRVCRPPDRAIDDAAAQRIAQMRASGHKPPLRTRRSPRSMQPCKHGVGSRVSDAQTQVDACAPTAGARVPSFRRGDGGARARTDGRWPTYTPASLRTRIG